MSSIIYLIILIMSADNISFSTIEKDSTQPNIESAVQSFSIDNNENE